jgi:hypothetical protein
MSHRERRALAQEVDSLIDGNEILVQPVDGSERESDVLGFVCFTRLQTTSVVHYLSVRNSGRRQGIGRKLMVAAGVEVDSPIPCTRVTPKAQAAAGHVGARLMRVGVKDFT